MGGLALLARAAGHRVTGCDANVYPPMSTQLQEQGVELVEGYDASQVALNPDCFVVGNAISRGNPLLEEILDRNLCYVSGPQWLAEHVLPGKWVLGVAGTHGKTTTTAMLAWLLEQGGLNPGFLVGGVPVDFGVSARWTDSSFFVIEADEYDTAFCDKRSKFVHYRPRTLILNNLEFDHADIFPDLVAIETQFHHLVRTVPRNGLIVANRKYEALERVLARGCWSAGAWFGDAAHWSVALDATSGEAVFRQAGEEAGRSLLGAMGEHNRDNALAAMLAARHVGVPLPMAMEALASFKGVKRRLENRGSVGGVTVYDDFAHHPTAIELTLAALRERVGRSRILAVVEPRSNTMKLGVMKARLPASLADADRVYCFANNLGWDAAEALAPLGEKLVVEGDMPAFVQKIARDAHPGDHVLVMSNGGFGGIHQKLLAALSNAIGN